MNLCPEGGEHRWRKRRKGLTDEGIFGLVEGILFGTDEYEECSKCGEKVP